jgi:hypothetical protein
MISSLAQEIAKWIAEHHGKLPSAIRVPEAVVDACVEECKNLPMARDKEYARKHMQKESMKILGIPVLVDPTLTIGKIDP